VSLLLFALAGSIAQLVDGALGMGFGLLSSTLLLTLGASAALASTAVHMAEIFTTLASGASHWHAENIDKKVLLQLAIPGGIGAFLGAMFLSFIDLSTGKIFISTILLFLGFLLLYRNLFASMTSNIVEIKNPRYFSYLGFTGGFVDASGGGGWGPIVTPTMMTTTSLEPRKIIGTVSAAEFIVAVSASIGFLININRIEMDWNVVVGLAIGGTLMAPVAAKIVGKLPRKQLATLVAIAIITINGYRLLIA
jgi:uncharacterized membrane protein YfcA